MNFTIDGKTKLITINSGVTAVSVRDLWSRWVDWFLTGDNSKYPVAFVNVGGESIDEAQGTSIPIYAFLMNGWKIKPQESNHTLSISDGILLVNGGGDPFNNTDGSYNVKIVYSQPVQAITVATGSSSISPNELADAVWGRTTDDLVNQNTTGKKLRDGFTKADSQTLL